MVSIKASYLTLRNLALLNKTSMRPIEVLAGGTNVDATELIDLVEQADNAVNLLLFVGGQYLHGLAGTKTVGGNGEEG